MVRNRSTLSVDGQQRSVVVLTLVGVAIAETISQLVTCRAAQLAFHNTRRRAALTSSLLVCALSFWIVTPRYSDMIVLRALL